MWDKWDPYRPEEQEKVFLGRGNLSGEDLDMEDNASDKTSAHIKVETEYAQETSTRQPWAEVESSSGGGDKWGPCK